MDNHITYSLDKGNWPFTSKTAFKFLKWTGLAFSPTEAFKKLLPILESRPIALATSDTSAPVASQIALMALMLEIRCARKALAAYRERSTWFQYRTLTNVFSNWSLWPLLIYPTIPSYIHFWWVWLIFALRVTSWFCSSSQLKRKAASVCNRPDCYLAWANLSFGRGTAKPCENVEGTLWNAFSSLWRSLLSQQWKNA